MFVPLWILVPAALLLLWLLARALGGGGRGGRGDMIERQRRSSPPAPRHGDPHVLGDPAIRDAIAKGRKIEAVRLAREKYGLDLKAAKELVERHWKR